MFYQVDETGNHIKKKNAENWYKKSTRLGGMMVFPLGIVQVP